MVPEARRLGGSEALDWLLQMKEELTGCLEVLIRFGEENGFSPVNKTIIESPVSGGEG